jgi:hypothetical protein
VKDADLTASDIAREKRKHYYELVFTGRSAVRQAHVEYETHRGTYRRRLKVYSKAQEPDKPNETLGEEFSWKFLREGQDLIQAIRQAEKDAVLAQENAAAAGVSVIDSEDTSDVTFVYDDEGMAEYLIQGVDRQSIGLWMDGVCATGLDDLGPVGEDEEKAEKEKPREKAPRTH